MTKSGSSETGLHGLLLHLGVRVAVDRFRIVPTATITGALAEPELRVGPDTCRLAPARQGYQLLERRVA